MKETTYKLSGPDICIALITDFHNSESLRITEQIKKHPIDIICIAGDFVLGRWPNSDNYIANEQENVCQLVSNCVKIAPTYISLGNHEWMMSEGDIKTIENLGAIVLDNQYIIHIIEGKKLVIGGTLFSIAFVSQKAIDQMLEYK